MKFILGQKKQMTQIFKDDGSVVPVTTVLVEPNVITQLKNQDKDGYVAVQVGSGTTKKSHTKAQQGHLKDLKPSRWLREFRFPITLERAQRAIGSQVQEGDSIDPTESDLQNDTLGKFKKGMEFGVEIFRPGDKVRVTGVSKGKGFQGVVKRHGFHGQDKSHGNKDQLRMPGSIGATGPAHVFKGMRMPGRMGTDKVTVDGLQVVKVDLENNLLYIKGALPGSLNSLVMIQGPGAFKDNTPKSKAQKKDEEVKIEENKESGIKNQGESTKNIESTENKKAEVEKENKKAEISNKKLEIKEENIEDQNSEQEEKQEENKEKK
jgi:large subunit ribosomal protein L3